MVDYVTSFSISESFILGGIGGVLGCTWVVRVLYFQGVDGDRIDCDFFVTCV